MAEVHYITDKLYKANEAPDGMKSHSSVSDRTAYSRLKIVDTQVSETMHTIKLIVQMKGSFGIGNVVNVSTGNIKVKVNGSDDFLTWAKFKPKYEDSDTWQDILSCQTDIDTSESIEFLVTIASNSTSLTYAEWGYYSDAFQVAKKGEYLIKLGGGDSYVYIGGEKYTPYIGDGAEWVKVQAYIGDGAEWVKY